MCGICGKIDPKGVTPETIKVMMEALEHRGPDDHGVYTNGTVGFGHRRLSIIDLDHGRQPMSNEDGSLQIVFNGEIYNYKDLRSRLRHSHRFATGSDTEVILHLYEEKGPACVDDLRGMFAFAIWDDRDESLFLARDHLGQKPLFYVYEENQLAFASEIKALLADNDSLREMDSEALHEYLMLRIISPPRTMFTRIRKLPPGHRLLFKDGKIRIDRYWQLRYQPKHELSESDLLEELEERILEAIRYHMVSDVPIGAFLSGGMDSSLIVAMMTRVTSRPFKTFSLGVPYETYSELPAARTIANQYQTSHFEETIYPSLLQILPELLWHLDEPSDPLSACMYYLAEMTSREVKVVIGGDGGDELFGGYDRYYGNRYVDYYTYLPRVVRENLIGRLPRLMSDGFWYKSFSHKLRWLNQMSAVNGGKRYARSLNYFYMSERYRQLLYGERPIDAAEQFDPKEPIHAAFDATNAEEPIDKMLYVDSMIRLPNHSVMILDRTTMAHGLEARSPFLDHKLVEFVARIPATLKVRGSNLRYIQKKLAAKYLPKDILRREKQGLSSPLPYLLAEEFRHLFRAFLNDACLVEDGYLRREPIQTMLSEHVQKKVDHGNRLWLLCNAEIWYRMAIKRWPMGDIKACLQPDDAIATTPRC